MDTRQDLAYTQEAAKHVYDPDGYCLWCGGSCDSSEQREDEAEERAWLAEQQERAQ